MKFIGALIVMVMMFFFLGYAALSFPLPDGTSDIIALARMIISLVIVFGLPAYVFTKIINSGEKVDDTEGIFENKNINVAVNKTNRFVFVVAIAVGLLLVFLFYVSIIANQFESYY